MPYKDPDKQRQYLKEWKAKNPTKTNEYSRNYYSKSGRDYHREYYKRRRQQLIEECGGKCVVCGTTENLEFDHIDRTTKRDNVTRLLATSSYEDALREAQKCVLLCKKHHIEKTKLHKDNLPI